MGLGRWLLTGRWKRSRRKPTLKERIFFGDKDNQRRHFTKDEIARIRNPLSIWSLFPGRRCAKCGSRKNLEIDHKKPLSMGGTNKTRNLRWLCRKCNRRRKRT